MVKSAIDRIRFELSLFWHALIKGSDERWFLLILPLYFLVMYAPVLWGRIPAPVDLALYHAPWTSAAPADWRGGSYVLSDIMDQMFPPIRMIFKALWSGDVPFYTDKIQNGVPWFLVGRHEILSPLLLLPALIAGPKCGFIITVMLKFLLGASFFILLTRAWGLTLFASTLGALVFIANAFPVQNLGNGIGSMYYLIPVAMYGIHRALEGKWVWTCLTPIVFFTIFTSGYPPAVAFHATLYGAYILFWMSFAKTGKVRAIGHLCFIGVATLLLAFPTLMESYEYLMKDLDSGYRTNYWARHLPRTSIGSLLMPWGYGEREGGWTWVREAIYIGVLPLLIAMSSLFLPNRQRPYIFFACFVGYLLLVLFNFVFLSHVYRYIPVLNGTNPNNQTMIFGYVMAIVVAFGAEQFETSSRDPKKVFRGVLLGLALLAVVIAYWWPIFAVAKVKHMIVVALALCASLAVIVFWVRTDNKRIARLLLLLFVAGDLILMGYGFNRTVPARLAYPSTPGVEYIKTRVGDGKIFSLESSMLADTPLWHGIRTVGGRGFFTGETKNLYRLINADAFRLHPTQYLFPADKTTRLNAQILDVLGVRFITANPPYAIGEKKEWIESFKDREGRQKFYLVHQGDMAVFENRSALGKAFLVPQVGVADAEDIYAQMKEEKKNLHRFAWLDKDYISAEDKDILLSQNGKPLEWKVLSQDLGNSYQTFVVRTNRPALMVIGDNYHRYWRVKINGKTAPLFKANYALRGILLPEGESNVQLSYAPDYLFWGMPVMVLGFLSLISSALYCVIRTRRRQLSR